MPDKRSHRGPHPGDDKLFGAGAVAQLHAAAADYAWLLNRGYAETSSLKLVGDRYRLAKRQRLAVARCVCSDEAVRRRGARAVTAEALAGHTLLVDGFNVVVTIEVALGGGVVLHARDGCYRDMSSMHGTYRKSMETARALSLVGELAHQLGVAKCCWYFDRPVSNSGRLVELSRELAAQHRWPWVAETVNDPDQVLVDCRQAKQVIATADSAILDRAGPWFNLARRVIDQRVPSAWIVDFTRDQR